MEKTFNNLEKGLSTVLPGIWGIFRGFLFLVGESFQELYFLFIKKRKKSRSMINRISVIITVLIILGFLSYGIKGLVIDLEHWIYKGHYEKVLYESYEQEIRDFFEKYNERFMAKDDCEFFRQVGADESMYYKYGNMRYPEKSYPNYCENVYATQEKRLIPIKIGKLEEYDNKYRIKGEMVVVTKNQDEPYFTQMMYYELWKELDWELRHFNGDKNGPKNIETKTRN